MEFPINIDDEPAQCWGRDVRLLVVYDGEFLRAIIRERVEIEGFPVEEAINGKEALAKLGYSILLTDIRMPERDGIAVLREGARRRAARFPMEGGGVLR
jgi:two-component system nitrogen regulation response regulator NtrX